MSETEKLEQLNEMLASDLIGKRKAGIVMATEMLANNQQREPIRTLLGVLAKDDLISTVRMDAQTALDADEVRRNNHPNSPPDYIFGARCTSCHSITYIDKRKACKNEGNLTRGVTAANGLETDAIWVTCKDCGKAFKASVPCKGYNGQR